MDTERPDATRHVVRLTLTKPTPLARLAYWCADVETPFMEAARPLSWELARLVPYRFRGFHERFARRRHFFWLPCPLCDRSFGGHEPSGSVPDPTRGDHMYLGVCAPCSARRQRDGVST